MAKKIVDNPEPLSEETSDTDEIEEIDEPPVTDKKDPAGRKQLDRVESGIGKILDTVQKRIPKKEAAPIDRKSQAANDDTNDDDEYAEPSVGQEIDDFLFGSQTRKVKQ